MFGKEWTRKEIAAMKRYYRTREWPFIRKQLPGRTDSAIRNMASQFGVARASEADRAKLAQRRRKRRSH